MAKSAKKIDRKKLAASIESLLKKKYPDAACSLNYKNPLQLLVATILSAQCTDERVNKVTADLFKKYKSAKSFAEADIDELMEDVRSTGFYKNKAKAIKSAATDLVEKHKGKVPDTMDELTALAGVGRKTANVVLGNAYNKAEGVVVDTHVGRLSQRWGITSQKDPVKVESDLMEILPQKDWTHFSHRAILFGREICQSRKPKCEECPINKMCSFYATNFI